MRDKRPFDFHGSASLPHKRLTFRLHTLCRVFPRWFFRSRLISPHSGDCEQPAPAVNLRVIKFAHLKSNGSKNPEALLLSDVTMTYKKKFDQNVRFLVHFRHFQGYVPAVYYRLPSNVSRQLVRRQTKRILIKGLRTVGTQGL